MNRKQLITLACYAAFIAIGACITILGPAKDTLTQHFGLPLKDGGIFLSLHFVGAVAGIVMAGILLDRINARYLLIGGALLMGMGLIALTQARDLWLAYSAMLLIGLGYGALDISPNLVVASLYPERSSIALNILNIMWGLGAAIGPQIANFALTRQDINLAFILTGSFSLLLIIPFALTSLDPPQANPALASNSAVNRWALVPFALLIFVYIGMENGFGGWIFTELTKITGSTESIATLATSLFWGGLMVGRVLASFLLRRLTDNMLLILMTLLIALGAGMLLLLPGVESIALLSSFLVGIGSGPIFPTSLAILNRRFTRGSVAGAVVAFGTMGGIVVPWVQGQVGADVSGGMIVTLVLGLVLFGLAAFVQRKPAPSIHHAQAS